MNYLKNSSSPYLLQHANNPVHWYPWGEAAFERARAEQKPVFLSIGYSTCHWCHVMAHESFENEEIAALLNEHFICVKLDREERPDIDRLYMSYVQALTGSGGWPMSVWLTPELKPFFGGTYFPPKNSHGRIGFPSVLLQLAQLWGEDRPRLEQEAIRALKTLESIAQQQETVFYEQKDFPLEQAYQQLSKSFDRQWGGFGAAPKFPRPSGLFFLFRYAFLHKDEQGDHAKKMALLTLDKMAAGGLQDHLGGGFHRYSVDAMWQVSHFEKMLYDQAQLVMAYLEAWQITGEKKYAEIVRATLDYVKSDLCSSEGGFYSAEDADSLDTQKWGQSSNFEFLVKSNDVNSGKIRNSMTDPIFRDVNSGKIRNSMTDPIFRNSMTDPIFDPILREGAFYVWSWQEIQALLSPEEVALVAAYYGLQPEGNISEGSDPHGELIGKNILMVVGDFLEIARKHALSVQEVEQKIARAKEKLLAARRERSRPYRDDKILTAWNGLMISGFARAGALLENKSDLAIAEQAAAFVREHLYDVTRGELRRSYREGKSSDMAFAEDYAFFIQGLLDLYEATAEISWLQWAHLLQKKMKELFWDAHQGSYFSSAEGDPLLLLRMKEDYDGAEPSANSIAALNLLRFSRMLHDEASEQQAHQIFQAAASTLEGMPMAVPQLLCSLQFSLMNSSQYIIAGNFKENDTQELLVAVGKGFHPDRVLLFADNAEGEEWLALHNPSIAEMKSTGKEKQATLYRCENFCCREPVSTEQFIKDGVA